jgi:hypothetical protein
MNIFILHLNTKKCAKYHCDKHVVKMILESTQLLSSTHHLSNSTYKPRMKLTHKSHPITLWVIKSLDNYLWLLSLAKELCIEYTYRYNKHHKCETDINDLEINLPSIPIIGFTNPVLAMPDLYKLIDEPVISYRLYYINDKTHLFNWKKREIPKWISYYQELIKIN